MFKQFINCTDIIFSVQLIGSKITDGYSPREVFCQVQLRKKHIDTVACEVKKFSCPQLEFHVTKGADEFPHYTCAGLFSTHFLTRHSLIFRFWILN